MSNHRKPDQILLQCIDNALTKFGEGVRKSIYYYLKRDFGLDKESIPRKLHDFQKALTSIFGEQGAKIIERMILTELKNTLQLESQRNLTFKELVKQLRETKLY